MRANLVDASGHPIYFSLTDGTTVGLATSAAATVIFNMNGLSRKCFSLKNGTNALVNGSLWASNDGVNWQVIDGTSFNTPAANAFSNSMVIDPRKFYMFTGSCGTVDTIKIDVSASIF